MELPKHLPLSPSHLLDLVLTPPRQELEQEVQEVQLLHFFCLPLTQSAARQEPLSSLGPGQSPPASRETLIDRKQKLELQMTKCLRFGIELGPDIDLLAWRL